MALSRRTATCGLCLLALPNAAKAIGGYGPAGIDISRLTPGAWLQINVDGVPICVRRRTRAEALAAASEDWRRLPDPESDSARTCDPEWLVVELVCSHGGCRPVPGLGSFRGWLCPCHGSAFDLSGRVRSGPAKLNLTSRSYRVEGDRLLVLPKDAACFGGT